MRFIPTLVHGVLDYLLGLLLIVSPWLLGFAAGGAETWTPVVIGAGVIVYSLVTRYELGVVPLLGMRSHLWLDGIGGLVLLASPWIFGFAEIIWVPHVVLGALEIGAALTTKTVPRGRSVMGRPAQSPAQRLEPQEPRASAVPHGTRTGAGPAPGHEPRP